MNMSKIWCRIKNNIKSSSKEKSLIKKEERINEP
jgi:hypothetical protein